jgi:hypothetical protein
MTRWAVEARVTAADATWPVEFVVSGLFTFQMVADYAVAKAMKQLDLMDPEVTVLALTITRTEELTEAAEASPAETPPAG